MKHLTYTADVLVIGSGAAGMATALNLAPLKVVLVTKTPHLIGGSTAAAQGGIATVHTPDDTPQKHSEDTHFAGAGLSNSLAVQTLTTEGQSIVEDLLSLGMPLDRQQNGELCHGLEAAHSAARIVHAGGDATGFHLAQTLSRAVHQARHINILPQTHVVSLLTAANSICGAWAYQESQGPIKLIAPHVVLATGGSGQLYSHTTNPQESTADGQALAYRAGATLTDMEFVQFHPTALAVKTTEGKQPLLTEALRGAGGKLVNSLNERFMQACHPLLELAPRDVVARAVWAEAAAGRTPMLDVRHIKNVRQKFPTVAKLCMAHGLNPQKDLLPVAPAAHYHMGGIQTNIDGRTNLSGLWAVGEVAATGVHGANRLASNSLLECLVFAKRTAHAIHTEGKREAKPIKTPFPKRPLFYQNGKEKLQQLMYQYAGLERDKKAFNMPLKN